MKTIENLQADTKAENTEREVFKEGEVELVRIKIAMDGIASAGYDALCAVLELEFVQDGQVWQFYDVPEQIWYEWRNTESCISFFHTYISGKYRAKKINR